MTDQKMHDARIFIQKTGDKKAIELWDKVDRLKWRTRKSDHQSRTRPTEQGRLSAVRLSTIRRTVTLPAAWGNLVEHLKTLGYENA